MTGSPVSIDGQYGEGGGSILRTALGLSAVTGRPVNITNIRKNRPRPGLAAQHLTGLKALAKLFNARTGGAEMGSTSVKFAPREATTGRLDVDVGTAGSIALMLQTLMIPLPFLGAKLDISLRGGTHVPWSPPIDYLQNVTIPLLRGMGYSCDLEVITPGFYPKGGGRAFLRSTPVRGLSSISLDDFDDLVQINGISRVSNLPDHIAKRQASSAIEALESISRPRIEISVERALCPGSAIIIWASTSTGCILGASALGKRGLPAEEVGRRAGNELRSYIVSRSPVDLHFIDQVIPYAALASGETILRGHKFTLHTKTNIHVVKKFVDCEIEIEGDLGDPCRVAIEGIGFDGE